MTSCAEYWNSRSAPLLNSATRSLASTETMASPALSSISAGRSGDSSGHAEASAVSANACRFMALRTFGCGVEDCPADASCLVLARLGSTGPRHAAGG